MKIEDKNLRMWIYLDFTIHFLCENHRRDNLWQSFNKFDTDGIDPWTCLFSFSALPPYRKRKDRTRNFILFTNNTKTHREWADNSSGWVTSTADIVFLFIFPEWVECRSFRSADRNTAYIRSFIRSWQKKKEEGTWNKSEKLYRVDDFQ